MNIKSDTQIEGIRKAGKLSAEIMEQALRRCVPGIRPTEIDKFVEGEITKNGAEPWFREVDNYPFATCIAVNEVWIHGMPSSEPLKEGDIVSVDIGVKLDGYYTDHCWTVSVLPENATRKDAFEAFEHGDPKVTEFLKTGAESLYGAISEFRTNSRLGNVSAKMQEIVESKGYSVVRDYSGHGVGLAPHEDPQLPCYGTRGAGPKTWKNMVMAIEIMYTMGNSDIEIAEDGWSAITKDRSLAAMFEHTVALTENGPEILTV
jgi:methionyl aminopeptidase